MPADVVSGEGLLSGLLMATFSPHPHMAERERERLLSLLIMALIPLGLGLRRRSLGDTVQSSAVAKETQTSYVIFVFY